MTKSPTSPLLLIVFLFLSGFLFAQAPNCFTAPELAGGDCGSECTASLPPSEIMLLPIGTIAVDFHIVLAPSPKENFQCSDPNAPFYAPEYIQRLLSDANTFLSSPDKNALSNSPKVPDTRIRFQLAGDPGNPCSAIFFHTAAPQSYSNPNVLHITLQDIGDEKAGGVLTSNEVILLRNLRLFVVEKGQTIDGLKGWATTINHEMGHRWGLCHTFSIANTCPDVDQVAECGGPSSSTCTTYDSDGKPDGSKPCPIVPPNSPFLGYCGDNACYSCFCTWGKGNNLMGYNGDQTGLTMYQWGKMYFTMAAEKPSFVSFAPVACEDVPPQSPIEIPSFTTETWNGIRILNRNVEVMPNATLIIHCQVRMAKDLVFIVHRGGRLFVEGGSITAQSADCRWGGILVHGNNTKEQPSTVQAKDLNEPTDPNKAGIVWLNGAIIENAITGISTSGSGAMGSESYHGGLVMVNSSDFVNCNRAIEFLRYGHLNKSYVRDCDILKNKLGFGLRGISIWGCHGIEFEEVHFEKISEYCFYGINFTAKIKSCKMQESLQGFRSEATMPNVQTESETKIENSTFLRNKSDVFCLASPNMVYGYRILNNNQFTGKFPLQPSQNNTGIFISGESKFTIQGNLFSDKVFSIRATSCGNNKNQIDCNNFITHSPLGINAAFNNSGLTILRNQFNGSAGTEISIQGNAATIKGQIAGIQAGSNLRAAGNCFNDPVSAISAAQTATEKFAYYVYRLLENPESCEKPTNNLSDGGINNYELKKADLEKENCNLPSSIPSAYTNDDLIDARNDAAFKKAIWQNDLPNNQKWTDYQVAVQHQADILDALLHSSFDVQDWAKAESLLLGEGTNAARRNVVGLRAARQDYAGAQSLLSAIPIDNQDDVWFNDIMAINFMVAQSSPPYHLSTQQETTLMTISNTPESLMHGYACALLSLCKGYRCEADNFLLLAPGDDRSTRPSEIMAEAYISPNPNAGDFTLVCPTALGESLSLDVMDLSGKIVRTLRFVNSGSEEIKLRSLGEGIYALRLYNGNSVLSTLRVVVAH